MQTTKRLKILTDSLTKKQDKLAERIDSQHARMSETHGSPINDKPQGASTARALEIGERAIFSQFNEIHKTEAAITRETDKIIHCKNWMEDMPQIIKDMVASGEIIQWRKYPRFFFVKGVEKGRFSIEEGKIVHRYLSNIPSDQYPLYRECANKIFIALKAAN